MGSVCDGCSKGKGTWCMHCFDKEIEESSEFLAGIVESKKDKIDISNIFAPRIDSTIDSEIW